MSPCSLSLSQTCFKVAENLPDLKYLGSNTGNRISCNRIVGEISNHNTFGLNYKEIIDFSFLLNLPLFIYWFRCPILNIIS